MKRSALIRHLVKNQCQLLREGSRHSIWKHMISGKISAIPRHNEIKNLMANKICKDLDVKKP